MIDADCEEGDICRNGKCAVTVEVPCTLTTYYRDDDQDGYGVFNDFVRLCENPGDKYALKKGDCDDADPNIKPPCVHVQQQGEITRYPELQEDVTTDAPPVYYQPPLMQRQEEDQEVIRDRDD